jgi:hypothetical protein
MNQPHFWTRFLVALLAIWRVTHLLAHEDGPADLIVKLRALLGDSLPGKLMDCFKCLSLWIAAPAALFVARTPVDCLFSWLALSGAACLLQRLAPDEIDLNQFHSLKKERYPMCCGQKRLALRSLQTPGKNPRPATLPIQRSPTENKPEAPSPVTLGSHLVRYVRTLPMEISGEASGRRYRFSAAQATQAVDPKDVSGLLESGYFSRI